MRHHSSIYNTTGEAPFSGETIGETIDQIIHAQPEALASTSARVPVELERVVGKCLEKDRELRYQSVAVYSFESQQYQRLTDFGSLPVWLNDSRRLLFQGRGKIHLVDRQSKKVHEVLSVAADADIELGQLSRDNRFVYFTVPSRESDVWLMTLR